MKTTYILLPLLLLTSLSAFEIKDKKGDWARGVADEAFDIVSLEIERIDSDSIELVLTLDDDAPDYKEKKTHYRFDFDLDLDDSTGHSAHSYGGDASVYVSLQPTEKDEKEWTTYVRAFSDIGERSDLEVVDFKVRRKKITVEVKSDFFSKHDQFGLYVMTFGNDIFYDELPNRGDVTVDLSAKKI